MFHHDDLVDATDFGTVLHYLHLPETNIDYVLHLRSREMLSLVAQRINAAFPGQNAPPEKLNQFVHDLVARGDGLVTTRQPLPGLTPAQQIHPQKLPRFVDCLVIYWPPFYLTHTPGLFEGMLSRLQPEVAPRIVPTVKRSPGLKS